jgi:hypothetical protein
MPIMQPIDQESGHEVRVPAGTQGTALCRSNASYIQRVTIKWTAQYNGVETPKSRQFEGNGEGMRLDTNTGETECVFHPRSDNKDYELTITFEYSSDNGVSWRVPMVTGPTLTKGTQERPEQIDFSTEDSSDGDNNDTYLTITFTYL